MLARILLLFFVGSLFGTLIGKIIVHLVPILSILNTSTGDIGLDFQVIRLYLNFNLASLLGGLVFIIVFRKYRNAG